MSISKQRKAEIVDDAVRVFVLVLQAWIADGNPSDVVTIWALRQIRQSGIRLDRRKMRTILAGRDFRTFPQVAGHGASDLPSF